jgi:hypothetical protein
MSLVDNHFIIRVNNVEGNINHFSTLRQAQGPSIRRCMRGVDFQLKNVISS